MKEVDLLMRELERLARIERYRDTGKESDLNPNIQNRNAVAKKQKNQIHLRNKKSRFSLLHLRKTYTTINGIGIELVINVLGQSSKAVRLAQRITLPVKLLSMH